MKLIIISLLSLVSFSSLAGVCCNPGGDVVPSMVLCPGQQNQNGSACCNPGSNTPSPITWNTGDSCGSSTTNVENCCKNKVPQGTAYDCVALGSMLVSMASSGQNVDVVGRCNQINGSSSCVWSCGGSGSTNGNNGNNGNSTVNPTKPERKLFNKRK
jgi:hypothetical protein